MTRLVVTGAGGYVGGSVVLAAASDPGISVRAVVRSPVPWLPGEVLVVGNLEEGAATAVGGAEAVIHLAGANEVACRDNPAGSLAATVAASQAVGEASARAGIRRLIYVSTVHVYGAALSPGAVIDEMTLPAPRSSYAIARLACEHTLAAVAANVEVVTFRLTNSVGPPVDPRVDRWSLVANDLCRQAAFGGPLKLLTSGQQYRDFVAMRDVARILLTAATDGAPAPGTYNLGSGEPVRIRDLADLIAQEATRSGLGAVEVDAPPMSPEQPQPYRVSVERLHAVGLRPTTPVRAALADTIAFCAANQETLSGAG